MFGVFDGHGPMGQIVSNVVATALPNIIETEICKLLVSLVYGLAVGDKLNTFIKYTNT